MTPDQLAACDEEFWPLKIVIQKTGRSRSDIYRRMREGSFPRSQRYTDSTGVFWRSSEVRQWQAEQLEALKLMLSPPPQPVPADLEMIG